MSSTSENRREDIVELVQLNGKVKVSELSERYNISEVSIRKDLEALEAEGHLSRIHGGAAGGCGTVQRHQFHRHCHQHCDHRVAAGGDAVI